MYAEIADREMSADVTENALSATLLKMTPIRIGPGQTRPLAFRMTLHDSDASQVSLRLLHRIESCFDTESTTAFTANIVSRNIQDIHKLTFLHPSGIVSYAMLKPPVPDPQSELANRASLPIMLSLHGAGLEADSKQVQHMFDEVLDLPAWVLFPTGVTPWSGDDWRRAPPTT